MFYKLYIKGKYGYEDAIYIKTKQELVNTISQIKDRDYLIIRNDGTQDEIIEYKPCNIVLTEKSTTKTKVKARTFYLDDKEIEKEMKGYIDR